MKIRKLNEELEDYPKYKVSSYYDYDKRGLEDDFETDDREEAKDKAWEFFQKGGVVVIENNYTGREVTLPDDEIEYIEDGGEFLNDFFNGVDESYKRKGLKEDDKNISESFDEEDIFGVELVNRRKNLAIREERGTLKDIAKFIWEKFVTGDKITLKDYSLGENIVMDDDFSTTIEKTLKKYPRKISLKKLLSTLNNNWSKFYGDKPFDASAEEDEVIDGSKEKFDKYYPHKEKWYEYQYGLDEFDESKSCKRESKGLKEEFNKKQVISWYELKAQVNEYLDKTTDYYVEIKPDLEYPETSAVLSAYENEESRSPLFSINLTYRDTTGEEFISLHWSGKVSHETVYSPEELAEYIKKECDEYTADYYGESYKRRLKENLDELDGRGDLLFKSELEELDESKEYKKAYKSKHINITSPTEPTVENMLKVCKGNYIK